jgi:hypothetical protein
VKQKKETIVFRDEIIDLKLWISLWFLFCEYLLTI